MAWLGEGGGGVSAKCQPVAQQSISTNSVAANGGVAGGRGETGVEGVNTWLAGGHHLAQSAMNGGVVSAWLSITAVMAVAGLWRRLAGSRRRKLLAWRESGWPAESGVGETSNN